MAFNYKPLWKQLIDHDMSKKEFAEKVNISRSTLVRMGRNENISMEILDTICNAFHCTPNDVIQHLPDEE